MRTLIAVAALVLVGCGSSQCTRLCERVSVQLVRDFSVVDPDCHREAFLQADTCDACQEAFARAFAVRLVTECRAAPDGGSVFVE